MPGVTQAVSSFQAPLVQICGPLELTGPLDRVAEILVAANDDLSRVQRLTCRQAALDLLDPIHFAERQACRAKGDQRLGSKCVEP